MYGRTRAHNAKARLADSYTELLHQIWAGSGDTPLQHVGLYDIIRPLAQGSFGTVYLAAHRLTRTKVVLKSAPKDQPNLVREIYHHRQFRHPHIATLYEVIVTENTVWLAMEYCPGNELFQYLVDHGRLKQDQVKRIFSQLAGAVAYTHSRNCAHRDLKLENTLLDNDMNVKLVDFGFTREYQSRVMLETVCGTVCYMAPEMISRSKYHGHSVDIWSLGVILYTLLYGEMPFEEETDDETKEKILFSEPSYGDPSVPLPAQQLVRRMLSKDPNERPSLTQILETPYLEEFACTQRSILANILKEQKPFSTKSEKRLLRALKAAHFDLHEIAVSVTSRKCDALSALWELSLAKQIKADAKRSHRPSLSIPKYVRRDISLIGDQPRPKSPFFRSSVIESNSEPPTPNSTSPLKQKHRSLSNSAPMVKIGQRDDRRIVTAPSSPVARLSFSGNGNADVPLSDIVEPATKTQSATISEPINESCAVDEHESTNEHSRQLEPAPSIFVEQAPMSPNPSVRSTRSSVLTKTRELKSHLKTAIMRFVIVGAASRKKNSKSTDLINVDSDNSDSASSGQKYAHVTGLRSMTSSGNSLIPERTITGQSSSPGKSSNLRFASTATAATATTAQSPQSLQTGSPTAQSATSHSRYSRGLSSPHGRKSPMLQQRPVSQISTLTNFSQLSFASSTNTTTNGTPAKKSHRPLYARRSTSSSISSLVSKTHYRSRSSCSSASVHSTNSNPDDRTQVNGSSTPVPTAATPPSASVSSPVLRHTDHRSRKFHESAVFSTSAISVSKRRRSPFAGMYRRKSTQRTSRVIEEDLQEIE